MSKQISETELATIVTKLPTGNSREFARPEYFQGFMRDLAKLGCDQCDR